MGKYFFYGNSKGYGKDIRYFILNTENKKCFPATTEQVLEKLQTYPNCIEGLSLGASNNVMKGFPKNTEYAKENFKKLLKGADYLQSAFTSIGKNDVVLKEKQEDSVEVVPVVPHGQEVYPEFCHQVRVKMSVFWWSNAQKIYEVLFFYSPVRNQYRLMMRDYYAEYRNDWFYGNYYDNLKQCVDEFIMTMETDLRNIIGQSYGKRFC